MPKNKASVSDYWSKDQVQDGVADRTVYIGKLRVNSKQHKDAYITVEGSDYDILIHGLDHRNKAFHDDAVAVQLLPEDLWKPVATDEQTGVITHQWQGRVVKVMESNHAKYCSGHIKLPSKTNKKCQFMPRNRCHPFMIVEWNEILMPFAKLNQSDIDKVLFLATIDHWPSNSTLPHGSVVQCLGKAGDIETETTIMLKENNIIDEEFPAEVADCLPTVFPWSIPKSEFDSRVDFRKHCVFTIDPATARDLDDALSCSQNDDGTWTVGVHIADVSYFVDEETALDEAAKERATSVYLVNRVIPMLPRVLCENLCSLNPGEDRLAYSVLWKIDANMNIVETSFHRSIIQSCAKLAYGHAQSFIDGVALEDPLPAVHGEFSMDDIAKVVQRLWSMAKVLRARRFDNGALKLHQPKLVFKLDAENNPVECFPYNSLPSNSLIEEFMLLANISVAEKIHLHFPNLAVLRRHPFPKIRALVKAVEICAHRGIQLDCIDSKSIQHSIDNLLASKTALDGSVVAATVTHYCSKAMELAQYFCSSADDDPVFHQHYALSIPIYTHFTSPIRRYPDIMVHRLLTAVLTGTTPLATQMANRFTTEHCNGMRLSARRVQDSSSELYFKQFIRMTGSYEGEGVVVGMLNKSVDVLLFVSRKMFRIHEDKMQDVLSQWIHNGDSKNESQRTTTLVWKQGNTCQKLEYFSKVNISITLEDGKLLTRLVL